MSNNSQASTGKKVMKRFQVVINPETFEYILAHGAQNNRRENRQVAWMLDQFVARYAAKEGIKNDE